MENEEKWILPKEDNPTVKSEVDESKGSYFCHRCKGWGYINSPDGDGTWIGMPLTCPTCEGSGLTDWVRNAMGTPTDEI
ncbi:MAG: hypothetical protein ACTSX1_09740 [Candidatus Heimdallarchaeaceae archaeon]